MADLIWWYGTVLPYMHARGKKFGGFNSAIERHTTKLSNLIPRQVLGLYGIHCVAAQDHQILQSRCS